MDQPATKYGHRVGRNFNHNHFSMVNGFFKQSITKVDLLII